VAAAQDDIAVDFASADAQDEDHGALSQNLDAQVRSPDHRFAEDAGECQDAKAHDAGGHLRS